MGANDEVLRAVSRGGVDQTSALLESDVRGEDEQAFAARERVEVVAALEDATLEDLYGFCIEPPGG